MTYVVVGGGLAGLIAAYKLSQKFPGADIRIVEKGDSVGGLLAGKLYDNGTYFDFGTHIFQETGCPELDEFVRSAVQSSELIEFPAGKGDISGVVFNGQFSERSHFPSLLGSSLSGDVIQDILGHVASIEQLPELSRVAALTDEVKARFGQRYADDVLLPLLADMYQRPAEELSGFALLLPGLSRVICVDVDQWTENSDDPIFRALVAFPDQRALPEHYLHTRKSFYSKTLGSRSFVFGVAEMLERQGVKIQTSSNINLLDVNTGQLSYTDEDGQDIELQCDGIVIAIGAVGAARLLGVDLQAFGFDKPMRHRVVNYVLSSPVKSGVFYFYGLDPRVDFYRVTNYAAFLGDSNDCRLSVEVLGERGIVDADLPAHLIEQLRDIGVLDDQTIVFSGLESLAAGFPVPTQRNMLAMIELAKHVEMMLPPNILLGGVGTQGGLFFQNEIIQDVYKRASILQ